MARLDGRRLRRAMRTGSVVLTAALLPAALVATAGGASADQDAPATSVASAGRALRADRVAQGLEDRGGLSALRASLRANATVSPYAITQYFCTRPDPSQSTYTVPASANALTLLAYGGDGGTSNAGTKGGLGSVAIGSIEVAGGEQLLAQPGCAGDSAGIGTLGALGGEGEAGIGGSGGLAGTAGEAGGGGGAATAWSDAQGLLLIGAGGGGAGAGGANAGLGGDGDHAGRDDATGVSKGGGPGTLVNGQAAVGAGGTPNGLDGGFPNGTATVPADGGRGGQDESGTAVGGGGGGAGYRGGGGGGQGVHLTRAAAGGGGGASGYAPDAAYVAAGSGAGHGDTSDGAAVVIRPKVITSGPYWPGWDIVRGVATYPQGSGGYVLDGFGGIHTFTQGTYTPPAAHNGPYWLGWDITRGIAVLPDGSGGYVLDGWGGLHPFALDGAAPPKPLDGPYWPNWDIARGVTILPDGSGGYVLDGFGGMHPFSITGPRPPAAVNTPYWLGFDIARGVTSPFLKNGTAGGWIADGWGGMHPWGKLLGVQPPPVAGNPYWPGWNIVRGAASFVNGYAQVQVDGYGGLHLMASPGLP